jgi:thymidylate synthase (FAD)
MDAQPAANTIASFYLSTWDDPIPARQWHGDPMTAWQYAQDAMEGKVLPNTLESIPVTFAITGVSRATTHQLVRTRVGAVFGQQGGRDNNWRDFNLRIPETWWENEDLVKRAQTLQLYQQKLYQQALGRGIPYQDARYVLPMGLETALVVSYNLLSFKSLCERRLCNRMMWETNYIVRLMADLVVRQFPFVGKTLRSGCERRGVCGSVSPMFPPSCVTMPRSRDSVIFAEDNNTLKETIEFQGDYDWPRSANGSWLHFGELDQRRLDNENKDDGVAYSLTEGRVLAIRNKSNGAWYRV